MQKTSLWKVLIERKKNVYFKYIAMLNIFKMYFKYTVMLIKVKYTALTIM